MTTYVIDTSTWISLAEHHVLGKSIFIPFWDALAGLAQAGTIVSPDEVLVELKAKDDAIYRWVRDHKRHPNQKWFLVTCGGNLQVVSAQ